MKLRGATADAPPTDAPPAAPPAPRSPAPPAPSPRSPARTRRRNSSWPSSPGGLSSLMLAARREDDGWRDREARTSPAAALAASSPRSRRPPRRAPAPCSLAAAVHAGMDRAKAFAINDDGTPGAPLAVWAKLDAASLDEVLAVSGLRRRSPALPFGADPRLGRRWRRGGAQPLEPPRAGCGHRDSARAAEPNIRAQQPAAGATAR